MDKTKEQEILERIKKRYQYSISESNHNRSRQKEDIRFAAASPDDPWQWDQSIQRDRELKKRPVITINKIPLHIRQVTNDIRQNRPSIRFRPADDKADPKTADILMGIVRHIEANSNADVAYDVMADNQVTIGEGYARIITDYISDDSFVQDIFIRPLHNSFKVHFDPESKDPSGADARWVVIDDEMSEDEFKKEYPDAEAVDWTFAEDGSWFSQGKTIKVAEYYEKKEEETEIYLWSSGETSYKGDPVPPGVFAVEMPVKARKTTRCKLMWYKVNGQQILDQRELPYKYIPVVRAIGNEWEVDGKRYRSGIVRNTKDSQRMYNLAQSAIAERVLLAPKAPWVAPVDAIEGYESIWQTANTEPHSFLPYNHISDDNTPIPPPQRTAPATIEPGLNQIAMGASDDIKSETGQFDASLGQKSNETSGRAIMARQREGDNATYHYIDNLARAVRQIGRIILEMIPVVYDTQRVAMILGEDGEAANVYVDPSLNGAYSEHEDEGQQIKRIFNPNVGTYDVYCTTGPSFTTKRIEAVEAMTQMTQANPNLWNVIGDLLVKNMDWPGAEDMAERLRLTLAPPIQASINSQEKIPPQIQQQIEQMKQAMQAMQQQLQSAHQAMSAANDEHREAIQSKEIELRKLQIAEYEAETARIKTLAEIESSKVAGLTKVAELEMEKEEREREPLPQIEPPKGGFFSPEGIEQ